jgi:hypothetical protein
MVINRDIVLSSVNNPRPTWKFRNRAFLRLEQVFLMIRRRPPVRPLSGPHFLIAASVRSVNAKIQAAARIEENWLRFAKEALIQLKVVSLIYALCLRFVLFRLRRHGRPLGNSGH